jgi:hypothetical protein
VPSEVQLPNLPDLKITRDGKAVDTSAIDNYDSFMGYLMQASTAANTAKIRKYFDDRTSIGEVENFALDITDQPQEVQCANPSQSIYVVNDGPGEIFVTINALGRTPTHLFVHEQMFDNFETHKLYRFYVWSAQGTIATARAKVKY